MSDIVIVVGTKRGKEHVSPIDLKQMCGRGGRKHGGETAVAHIIVEDDRIKDVQAGLENGEDMDVHSQLGDMDDLIFHLIPEIETKRVRDIASAEGWFSRSFFALQGGKANFEKVFDKMEKIGAIKKLSTGIEITKLGCIASDLYFHPADIYAWYENFTKLFELGLENDNAAIAWALGTRPNGKSHGDFGDDRRYIIEECRSALPLGLALHPGMTIQVVLWWCAMGGPSAGKMRNQMLDLREDIGRIKRALNRMDREFANWDRASFFSDMELMVRKGITTTLLDLCKLSGITKGRAEYLYNMGVRDVDGIVESMNDFVDEVDESFANVLKDIAHEFSRQSH